MLSVGGAGNFFDHPFINYTCRYFIFINCWLIVDRNKRTLFVMFDRLYGEFIIQLNIVNY